MSHITVQQIIKDRENNINHCDDKIPQEPILYIPAKVLELYPGVFVEKGTEILDPCTLEGKMQQLAFDWSRVYVNSIADLEGSIELLKEISYKDSQLYFPSQFGYLTSQQLIIDDIIAFNQTYSAGSVFFPNNGAIYDVSPKYGVVGSNKKIKCFYHFGIEVQFRQTTIVGSISTVTNDCWSLFINKKGTKFYQIKEWLDGRIRRIQPQRTPQNNEILILDTNNINLIPFPPVAPGVTILSIAVIANAIP